MRAPAPCRRLVALGLILSVTISGCSEVEPDNDPAPTWVKELAQEQPSFPAGAQREEAGSHPPVEVDAATTFASIRPDRRSPAERIPEIVKRGYIIVGVDQSQNLLSYRDPATGELSGFEIDLARNIARDIFDDPHAIDFRFIDASDRVSALDNGTVDMVIRTMTITPERQEQVAFSVPYFTSQTRVLAHKGSGTTGVNSLHGRTVCVADQSTALQHARAYAPNADILRVRNWADCLVALQQDQVDAVVGDDSILAGIAAQDPTTEIVGRPIGEESYGVGIAQPDRLHDTTGLIQQVNSTIERIIRDGTWRSIYTRTLGPYQTSVSPPEPHYLDEEGER
ncbi:ABC transporter glutamine-binding protein GlnH precursor [Corynebacterium ciconiae DSM 44920]|uniref:glutamate ABC transporter substrate-binding protein n=1 Tax=Corynebacterium ciconiae TaxID=227319 RepID=UPI0003753EBC|nr:glutamate ABC transporter substrate-binding protein [Corynebacterium ciconiae]WKD62002.1 ABC transporter glutamine-binding protein GlnH precursor [Corynebacterium ciconiae DSM 44920]